MRDDHPWHIRWQIGSRLFHLAGALGALAMMALIWKDLDARRHADAHRAAQAVASGYERARVLTDAEAEDEYLTGDEADAGAMWARSHLPDRPDQCPTYTAAFHRGCAGYIDHGAP